MFKQALLINTLEMGKSKILIPSICRIVIARGKKVEYVYLHEGGENLLKDSAILRFFAKI